MFLVFVICLWLLCSSGLSIVQVDDGVSSPASSDDEDRTESRQTLPGLLLNHGQPMSPHIIKNIAQSHNSFEQDENTDKSVFENDTDTTTDNEHSWDAINHSLGHISLSYISLICLLHLLSKIDMLCAILKGDFNFLKSTYKEETETNRSTGDQTSGQQPRSSETAEVRNSAAMLLNQQHQALRPEQQPVSQSNPGHFVRFLLPGCTWTKSKIEPTPSPAPLPPPLSSSLSSSSSSKRFQKKTAPLASSVKLEKMVRLTGSETQEITAVPSSRVSGIMIAQAKREDSFQSKAPMMMDSTRLPN